MQEWECLFIDVLLDEVIRINGETPKHLAEQELGGLSTRERRQAMKGWRRPRIAEYANQLGNQGWELVEIVGEDAPSSKYVFKLPKS